MITEPAAAPGRSVRYSADAVVTVDSDTAVHRPGVLDVVGNRIAWVGPASDAPTFAGEHVALGGLVMPGFVNTHAHTPMTLLRGAGDGLPLLRWLEEVIWPREGRLTGDDVRWGMLLGCDELLVRGVTTTCEQYAHHEVVAEAALESGIRSVVTPGIFEFPEEGGSWRRFLAEAEALFDAYDGRDGRLTVGLGPHSAYVLPPEALEAIAASAISRDALIQIHLSETAAEDEPIRRDHGCSAPALLERLGVFDARVLAAHSVWLSDADLDRYVAHDVAVAHCPTSNAKLGSGVARVVDMLARGLRVGLGTDGPASNNRLDIWEEMRLAPLMARGVSTESEHLTTAQALHLATRGGADALGLEVGSLEPGRLADFIRVDLDDACFVPDDGHPGTLLAHLVWAASSRLVTDVWVDGERRVASGRSLAVDAAQARAEVQVRGARLGAALGVELGVELGNPA